MFATKFGLLVAVLCVLTIKVCHTNAQEDPGFGRTWNYSDSSAWPLKWAQCGGQRQSPIDIDPFRAVPIAGPQSNPQFIGYDAIPSNMTMTNTGDEVQIHAYYPEGQVPYMEGNFFSSQYIFKQLHFHWGPNDNGGSEHTIEGRGYPLEMHMVHIRREYLYDEDAAWRDADGFVTVARLFNVTPVENPACMKFGKYLGEVTEPGTEIVIDPFPLTDFDFYENDNFWTYPGSLTAPNCAEVITWVIPTTLAYIAESQLEQFRAIRFSSGDDHNNRPTQPLGDRHVSFVLYDDNS